jgi:hypothetical protein
MTPYYQHGLITIYCGDARKVLAEIEGSWESMITDPPWPDGLWSAPDRLLHDVLKLARGRVRRVVVELGVDSDPRLLRAVPDEWSFLRVCWLEYSVPSYKGRLLYTGDVAYVFGYPPAPRPGARVLPGRCVSARDDLVARRGSGRHKTRPAARIAHPCPRRLEFLLWLVRWYGGASVIDPFMGSGTTLVACQRLGIPAVGIEIEPEYCELAVERLRQPSLFESTEEIYTESAECQRLPL